jgi:hypothetical protein
MSFEKNLPGGYQLFGDNGTTVAARQEIGDARLMHVENHVLKIAEKVMTMAEAYEQFEEEMKHIMRENEARAARRAWWMDKIAAPTFLIVLGAVASYFIR